MNERIEKLATEVGMSVEYLTNTKQIVLLEKFAQLIIEECIQLVTNSQHENTVEKYDEYFKGFNESLIFAQNRIQQHFGVNNEPTI